MAWTKEDLVNKAYAELALAGYVYDLDPEEMQNAGSSLDSMMALWNGLGINLGYPISSDPKVDLDVDCDLPDMAREPVYMNLAIRLAAGKGKQLMPSTLNIAKQGYDALSIRAAIPSEVQMPGAMPLGSGNKPWRMQNRRFATPPCDPLTTQGDTTIDFE